MSDLTSLMATLGEDPAINVPATPTITEQAGPALAAETQAMLTEAVRDGNLPRRLHPETSMVISSADDIMRNRSATVDALRNVPTEQPHADYAQDLLEVGIEFGVDDTSGLQRAVDAHAYETAGRDEADLQTAFRTHLQAGTPPDLLKATFYRLGYDRLDWIKLEAQSAMEVAVNGMDEDALVEHPAVTAAIASGAVSEDDLDGAVAEIAQRAAIDENEAMIGERLGVRQRAASVVAGVLTGSERPSDLDPAVGAMADRLFTSFEGSTTGARLRGMAIIDRMGAEADEPADSGELAGAILNGDLPEETLELASMLAPQASARLELVEQSVSNAGHAIENLNRLAPNAGLPIALTLSGVVKSTLAAGGDLMDVERATTTTAVEIATMLREHEAQKAALRQERADLAYAALNPATQGDPQ